MLTDSNWCETFLLLFSNGSIIVNHTVVLDSNSNASTQQLEAVLKKANHTNSGGYLFGQVKSIGKNHNK